MRLFTEFLIALAIYAAGLLTTIGILVYVCSLVKGGRS